MSLLIPKGDNLVTYYLLPLLGLNKKSFGDCFHASYVDCTGDSVYVELRKNMVTPTYLTNPNYVSRLVIKERVFLIFLIPTNLTIDSAKFIRGQYSDMSRESKKIIYKTSTLPYNKTMGSFAMTHPVLQALDKTKTLRSFLVNELDVVINSNNELIDPPSAEWFIETRIKNDKI